MATFASIVEWSGSLTNVLPPVEVDAGAARWPAVEAAGEAWDALYACNVCHIAPFAVSEGLLAGASRLLRPGGNLFLYGPFMVDGKQTAESNEAFDARLRAQNAAWGVRDSTALAALATTHGLQHRATEQMRANNLILVFERVEA